MQVLIFSQFKIMLDVLEDYLRLKGFPLERIDGSVAQRDREAAIDRYSAGLAHACSAQTALLQTTMLLPAQSFSTREASFRAMHACKPSSERLSTLSCALLFKLCVNLRMGLQRKACHTLP